MFQFPKLSLAGLCVQPAVTGHDPSWVPPFVDLRVEGCVRLSAAYRSLPRPSSTSCAKASTVRSYYLYLTFRYLHTRLTLYHFAIVHVFHYAAFKVRRGAGLMRPTRRPACGAPLRWAKG